MGTGIVSILLHNFPFRARWLYWLSVIVFCLNVLLFVTFTIISVLRYTLYRGIFSAMLRHPVQSLFLGRQSFIHSFHQSRVAKQNLTPHDRHDSNGPGHNRQHDRLRLRPRVGSLGDTTGLGSVVV